MQSIVFLDKYVLRLWLKRVRNHHTCTAAFKSRPDVVWSRVRYLIDGCVPVSVMKRWTGRTGRGKDENCYYIDRWRQMIAVSHVILSRDYCLAGDIRECCRSVGLFILGSALLCVGQRASHHITSSVYSRVVDSAEWTVSTFLCRLHFNNKVSLTWLPERWIHICRCMYVAVVDAQSSKYNS